MPESTIEADYLIVGAGAAGMAFADSVLSATEATMVIVDRHDRPGGHWNDAYPFVRLHQPAALYGVDSYPLGSGAKDEVGLNQGMHELASGQEVLSHFDSVMRQRFLPSGRVHYLPMADAAVDGTVTSLMSGERTQVRAGKVVDATYASTSVPSTHRRPFAVAADAVCIPPNHLPRMAPDYVRYVVIGAGKTAMDVCIWLLDNGAHPDRIRWIRPRDAWLLNRETFQPGKEFFERAAQSLADQVEALARATTKNDVFVRLEAVGDLFRIDPDVVPEAHHCAIISSAELEQLRRIHDVVRLGRVARIESRQIVLEHGHVDVAPGDLHIDCTARGVSPRPAIPVFAGDRITPQVVRLCQPIFSAALIGHVEAVFDDEDEKNRICRPVPVPDTPTDWLRRMAEELANRRVWSTTPQIADWIARSRLDAFSKQIASLDGSETAAIAHLQRYAEHVRGAIANLSRLLESEAHDVRAGGTG